MGSQPATVAEPPGDNAQGIIDDAVLAKLPQHCKLVSLSSAEPGFGVKTTKIVCQLDNHSTAEFFKKDAPGPIGAKMMKGAFESERAVHGFMPDRVPAPLAWGTYATDPNTHFYMCEFVEMYDKVPNANDWAAAVSQLHIASMGKSPTGQFGFHVTTHLANVPVNNTWNPSWQTFWAQQMKGLFDREEQVNGLDETVTNLRAEYFKRAIPRFLGPLESEGRTATDELCLFDSCAYWGHNEADLAICYNTRYKLGQPCLEEYRELVSPSEPKADFDHRNALYAMKYHVLLSIMYSDKKSFRERMVEELTMVMAKVDLSPSGQTNTKKPSHLWGSKMKAVTPGPRKH